MLYRITLTCKDGPWKRNKALDGMIGYYILRLAHKAEDSSASILAETPFVPEHTISNEYHLQPQALYTVMPTTYAAGQQGAFTVSVSSAEDFDFTEQRT